MSTTRVGTNDTSSIGGLDGAFECDLEPGEYRVDVASAAPFPARKTVIVTIGTGAPRQTIRLPR